MGGEWICLGVVDLLGIISFFLLSLVVRKLVVGYLKDTNAGEWKILKKYCNLELFLPLPKNKTSNISQNIKHFTKVITTKIQTIFTS